MCLFFFPFIFRSNGLICTHTNNFARDIYSWRAKAHKIQMVFSEKRGDKNITIEDAIEIKSLFFFYLKVVNIEPKDTGVDGYQRHVLAQPLSYQRRRN